MNWELICWIAAGIIIAEIVYIIWYRKETYLIWGGVKAISYVLTAFFMFIQSGIVFGTGCGEVEILYCQPLQAHYEYLLIELGILLFVALLVLINRFIAKKIDKNRKKE